MDRQPTISSLSVHFPITAEKVIFQVVFDHYQNNRALRRCDRAWITRLDQYIHQLITDMWKPVKVLKSSLSASSISGKCINQSVTSISNVSIIFAELSDYFLLCLFKVAGRHSYEYRD